MIVYVPRSDDHIKTTHNAFSGGDARHRRTRATMVPIKACVLHPSMSFRGAFKDRHLRKRCV
jgi:hypothetical protein